jgi:hypothetical protein
MLNAFPYQKKKKKGWHRAFKSPLGSMAVNMFRLSIYEEVYDQLFFSKTALTEFQNLYLITFPQKCCCKFLTQPGMLSISGNANLLLINKCNITHYFKYSINFMQ